MLLAILFPIRARRAASTGMAACLWLATVCLAGSSFALLLARPVHAQDKGGPSGERLRTESPYFLVKSDDPSVDRLPLKATDVRIKVSGVIAEVTVTQHYRNEGTRPLEARYVFPGSTRAAVGGLDIRLGDRLVAAQIREKQKARIDYEAARNEGRTAALLEQHLPNVFQMNVANILPGDDVQVELRYTELLVPESGTYCLLFPTVVGPRYNSPASGLRGAPWAAQPTLRAGVVPAATFDLQVTLDAPMQLGEILSSTHRIDIQRSNGERHADIRLADRGQVAQDRDFMLHYRLAGASIQTGLMLHQGQGAGAENFFLAMVEPPQTVAASTIMPRDYIFIVDISGSMHGFPLDTAKTMLERLIGGLRPSDTFNVLLFSGSSKMLAPQSVPATRANIDRALATLANYAGNGSTELIPALRRAYAEPKPADVSRTMVVVTDGYVTVEREAFELVRRNLAQANLFAFGIGSSVNRHLIEGLARAGMGEPFVITDPEQAPQQATRFRKMIESPVLTGVTARFDGFDAYDVEPAALPDVLANRPVVLFGKWRGKPGGRLVIEGRAADGPFRKVLAIDDGAIRKDAVALRSLWARHRIATLGDQESLEGGDALRQAITDLGLRYALLTSYTSFIAIDQAVRTRAAPVGVDQPLPLPSGVSELALGGSFGAEVPSTPEPELLGAVAVMLSMLAMLRRRARRCDARRFTA